MKNKEYIDLLDYSPLIIKYMDYKHVFEMMSRARIMRDRVKFEYSDEMRKLCGFPGDDCVIYSDIDNPYAMCRKLLDMNKDELDLVERTSKLIYSSILSSEVARTWIPMESYRDFVNFVDLHAPRVWDLQVMDDVIYVANGLIYDRHDADRIKRISEYNDRRKEFAKEFIGHFDNEYKKLMFEELGFGEQKS